MRERLRLNLFTYLLSSSYVVHMINFKNKINKNKIKRHPVLFYMYIYIFLNDDKKNTLYMCSEPFTRQLIERTGPAHVHTRQKKIE